MEGLIGRGAYVLAAFYESSGFGWRWVYTVYDVGFLYTAWAVVPADSTAVHRERENA